MDTYRQRGKSRAKLSRKALGLLGGASLLVLAALPAQADDTLRIISFNTWGRSSLVAEAVDLFTYGRYDIITLQEYNSAYGNSLQAGLLNSGAGSYWLHSSRDLGIATYLEATTGIDPFRRVPYVKLSAEGSRPATIVATEHLNYFENPFTHRVGQSKQLNEWARSEATPIILTGDFNGGDVAERGLLNVVQQEFLLDRARTGSADYKTWALQYVARNHPPGSEKYEAARAFVEGRSSVRPTDLFTDELYPVMGNTPNTMNIVKKEYQLLQNPETRERFAPHELGDGSTTWPSVEEDDEAFKWPSWGRVKIDHFLASRPYAKWWELVDEPGDPYVGGVLDQSVSTRADGTALSDHEPVGHEFRWVGPRLEEVEGASGQMRLIFDAGARGFDADGEFQLSRNNRRTDVYLGQLSDADGRANYQHPDALPRDPISQDALAYLVANAIYDRHDPAGFQAQLASYIPTDKKDVFDSYLAQLLDPGSGDGYYRNVIQNYFDAHRDEFPGIDSIGSMTWEQWGYILMNHMSGDLTFQNVPNTAPDNENWDELWATLGLADPAVRALLSQQTGLDFENDPYAPLKLQLDCSNVQHLALQGARDMCVDDHGRFKDAVIADGKTVAIDESDALGASDGVVTLDNGGIRTAGPDDAWAAWADPVTRIDKAVQLDGLGWIEISHPTVPVEMAQSISGPGTFEKRGPGMLELMAVNGYTGGTVVQAGTLRAGVEGALPQGAYAINDGVLDLGGYDLTMTWLSGRGGTLVIDAGALTLDQAAETAYAGSISGDGHFAKVGTGSLALTGDSSGFAGTTQVAAGLLAVNGRLGGIINVAGGTLGGSGTIGTTTIAAGGTLAPGSSMGTLTVDGDLTFEHGSLYQVEVDPEDAQGDLVKVLGTAILSGGSVAHIGANGSYDLRSTYTILSAAALNGAFEGVTSDFAFLNPNLLYDYDLRTVDLELVRNDRGFASVARTRNQIATANGIESIGLDKGHPVYSAIAQLPDDADLIRRSFDQLSGEIHASAKSVLIEESHLVRNAAENRLRAAFDGVGAQILPVLAYGPGGAVPSAPDEAHGLAAWGYGFGSWDSFRGDGNAASVDTSTGGFLLGADAAMFETWRLGVLAGYSHSSFHADARRASGSSDNFHLGLYGGAQWGNLGFRTGLAHSWHDVQTSRSVSIPGLSDRLTSGYDARTLQAFGELGYRFDAPSVSFEPFANLAYVKLRTDGFAEEGGAAGLLGASSTAETTFTTFGLRASMDLALSGMQATARGMVGWRRAFGDTSPLSTHTFAGSDGFSISGVPIAKDAALLEAGLDIRVTDTATLGFAYQGQFGDGVQHNGFNAKLQVRF
jgi:outer membrane autotransporter protein